ncbi:hypothetical protein BTE54_23950 [Agrobacterium sp. YIC 4121]|nr:hypothetical protein BTE54_23950 [Agrobacterium sp. YIC 4121]
MVGCKELVARVSEVTGTPHETVTVIDRLLAEAGLRTRSRRGRGQTEMTPLDASRLLYATIVSTRAVDAVRVVEEGGEAISDVVQSVSLGLDITISFKRSPCCTQAILIKSPNLMGEP